MAKEYHYEFEYDSRYCYPNSKVLKNKLNILDAVQLENAERKITSLRTMEAIQKGIRGKFDFNHLKRIHKFLFGDIYSWAGKVRLVNISKGNQFCKVEFIEQQMLLKQIIMTKSIPFEVKMSPNYSINEITEEVQASMTMENMPLTEDDIHLLRTYQASTESEKENIRNQLIVEYTED